MKTFTTCTLLAAALLSAGCTTTRSDRQDDTPPRLLERNKTVAWDHGEAFGPVPLKLAALAALNCATLDTRENKFQAEGFHAKAQDLDGKTFPGGGYYCKPRARSKQ